MRVMFEERCSFCGKNKSEVYRLFTENNVYICDGCVKRCNDLLFHEKVVEAAEKAFTKIMKEIIEEK